MYMVDNIYTFCVYTVCVYERYRFAGSYFRTRADDGMEGGGMKLCILGAFDQVQIFSTTCRIGYQSELLKFLQRTRH